MRFLLNPFLSNLVLLLFFVFPRLAMTEPLFTAESGPEQVALVELYTSEGCSSCPPAEDWLNQLKQSAGLWTRFVPLAFHVHYWDYIGWKDRFAKTEYTQRQKQYVQQWQGRTLYTPCMVYNGREFPAWRNGKNVPLSGEKTGVLNVVEQTPFRFEVIFNPVMRLEGPLQVHTAVLGMGIKSSVTRGENRDKILEHDFVVLQHQTQLMIQHEDQYKATVVLSAGKKEAVTHYALVFWVDQQTNLTPIQALGGVYNRF